MCDVCKDESGGKDVGVAAVPAAPVSVMWCDNCLRNNAIPLFVVETWLFTEFSEENPERLEMKEQPPAELLLAEWALEQTVWMGKEKGYVTIKDAFPELWKNEYIRITEAIEAERQSI